MRSRPQAIATLIIGSLLLGLTTVACGSTCESLAADYEAEVRQRMALAGTGVAPISAGYHHIGMTLSLDFLDRLLRQADESITPISRPLAIDESATGRRASVRVEATASVDGIEIVDPRHDTVRVRFGISAQATIRRVGSRETHFLLGAAVVDGRLLFELDEDGYPVLVVTFDDLASDGSQIAVHALTEEIGDAIRGYVEPGIANLLLDDLEQVTLMRFPPITLQSLDVSLAPIDLALIEADQAVFLGFVTNLRPTAARELRPKGEIPEGGIRLTIHPELIAAAVRLGMENGALPHRFDRTAQVDTEGPVRVTFDRFDFSSQGVELDFGLWDLEGRDCSRADISTSGSVQLQENAIGVVMTDIDAPEVDDSDDSVGDAGSWLRSGFTTSAVALAEELIGLYDIELGTGEALRLRPVALSISTQVIEVDFIERQ